MEEIARKLVRKWLGDIYSSNKHVPDLQHFGEHWALKLAAISVVISGKSILD
jgi:hypothetical protein